VFTLTKINFFADIQLDLNCTVRFGQVIFNPASNGHVSNKVDAVGNSKTVQRDNRCHQFRQLSEYFDDYRQG